jgi:hypothetical protein
MASGDQSYTVYVTAKRASILLVQGKGKTIPILAWTGP